MNTPSMNPVRQHKTLSECAATHDIKVLGGDKYDDFDQWVAVVEAVISEQRPNEAEFLALAKSRGASRIELRSDLGVRSMSDDEALTTFSRQLYTVLLKKTAGDYNKIVSGASTSISFGI